MLELPIHKSVRLILVSPHYPENLGAACRAAKTMGFLKLGLVRPSRLATPEHPMAVKMAVKSGDILEGIEIFENLDEALVGSDIVVGTTAKKGVSGIVSPSKLAHRLLSWAVQKKKVTIVFGNEKTGLSKEDLARCDLHLRIPIAAAQPSLNLAQAVQIICYALFNAALEARESQASAQEQ
ncbi:MAG: RNA methyltransferase [Polyangiaceae bacterium]|nr:RNA methyltransferase [Polyangiaceae bacterium]